MEFESVSHISKILWRFFGSSSPGDPLVGLDDIQFAIDGDKVIFQPWHGSDGKDKLYTRQIQSFAESFTDTMSPPINQGELEEEEAKGILYAEEPKAVCFCDIPINHLALHMKKYNCVGFGIDRDLIADLASDLQPVRYYHIKKLSDFDSDVEDIFKVRAEGDNKIIALERYVKIPTLFQADKNLMTSDKGLNSPSESFDSIYEEREWRLFEKVTIDIRKISFLLLPSREEKYKGLRKLEKFFEHKVGVIYADELFKRVNFEKK